MKDKTKSKQKNASKPIVFSKRYSHAAERFWEVLEQNRGTLKIPNLEDELGRIIFPYDTFCKANPLARKLMRKVEDELHYYLSEYQASWGVMNFVNRFSLQDYNRKYGTSLSAILEGEK